MISKDSTGGSGFFSKTSSSSSSVNLSSSWLDDLLLFLSTEHKELLDDLADGEGFSLPKSSFFMLSNSPSLFGDSERLLLRKLGLFPSLFCSLVIGLLGASAFDLLKSIGSSCSLNFEVSPFEDSSLESNDSFFKVKCGLVFCLSNSLVLSLLSSTNESRSSDVDDRSLFCCKCRLIAAN